MAMMQSIRSLPQRPWETRNIIRSCSFEDVWSIMNSREQKKRGHDFWPQLTTVRIPYESSIQILCSNWKRILWKITFQHTKTIAPFKSISAFQSQPPICEFLGLDHPCHWVATSNSWRFWSSFLGKRRLFVFQGGTAFMHMSRQHVVCHRLGDCQ